MTRESAEIRIIEVAPDSDEALMLIRKSVDFTKSLYPIAEQSHSCDVALLAAGRLFLVWHHAAPIGCGAYVWRGADEIELRHIYLEPESRGLGCGRMLLQRIEDAARQDAVNKIVLETTRKQDAAVRLYLSFGYAFRAPYIENPKPHSLFMEKLLRETNLEVFHGA